MSTSCEKDKKVDHTIYCSMTTSGADPSGVRIRYWATVMSSGDVWARGEVGTDRFQVTSSRFYDSKRADVMYADVGVEYDLLAPFDGKGVWGIGFSRLSGRGTATYYDGVTTAMA